MKQGLRRFVPRIAVASLALAASLAMTVVGPAGAASPTLLQGLKYDGGFQEIIISVPDIDEAALFYQRVAGWRVRSQSTAES